MYQAKHGLARKRALRSCGQEGIFGSSGESALVCKRALCPCEREDIFVSEGRRGQLLIGLLEDDLAIQEMLRLLLQGEGYEVAAYTSAEECLVNLHMDDMQQNMACPDLLIVDLHLARSASGLEVIEQIRLHPRLASLPVILMTASAFVDKQSLQHLHVTLLSKPFDIDEILRIVDELTSS